MPNELELGARREGQLIDFDPDTPQQSVTLERTDDGISLIVPWADYESPYAGWFVDRKPMSTEDGASAPVPKCVLFQDSHGSVLLVGCWPRGYHTNWFGPGSGRVSARYAILGVRENLDFRFVHGLRTEISGLQSWLGVSSISESHAWPTKTGPHALTVTAKAPDEIKLGGTARLRLLPGWTQTRAEGAITIGNVVHCESRSASEVSLTEAEQPHLAIRDLLVISQWRAETCQMKYALRDDDPLTTLDNKTHGEQWRTVVSARSEAAPQPISRREHLIEFAEVGVQGVKKWLRTRETFARALDPVISTRYLDSVSPMTLLAQTGPGVEALGYLLMRRDGVAKKTADNATLKSRLERVLKDVEVVLPFDGRDWVLGTVATYNSLKHANRRAAVELDVLNRWRETVLATRAWVALEVGTPEDSLKKRLKDDKQAYPYTLVDN